MDKIRELGELLKRKEWREIWEFLKKNKKFTEKGILILLIAVCGIIFFAGNDGNETIPVERGEAEQLAAEEMEKRTDDGATIDEAIQQIYVDVQGAVNKPGVVKLSEGARVFQAIEAAGGTASMGDTGLLNLAQELRDGDKLYVPFRGEEITLQDGSTVIAGSTNNGSIQLSGGTAAAGAGIIGSSANGGSGGSGKININTATSEELQSLNGIGIVSAGKIIDYRTQNGRFAKIEDIKSVSGIGDKTFENIKNDICV